MQYGFKNCCNSNEYFVIEDIPAYVNVGETWFIQTTQCGIIAATYGEIPPLNYTPQVFNWTGSLASGLVTNVTLPALSVPSGTEAPDHPGRSVARCPDAAGAAAASADRPECCTSDGEYGLREAGI